MNKKVSWAVGGCLVLLAVFLVKNFRQPPSSNEASSSELMSSSPDKNSKKSSVTEKKQTSAANSADQQKKSAPVPTNGVPVKEKTAQNIEDYLKSLDPKANWKIRRDDQGSVTVITGGFISNYGKSPEVGFPLAQELADYMKVDPQSLVIDHSFKSMEKSPLSDVLNYKQSIEGYEVYGASLRMFTRTKDNTVYYINNELKNTGTTDMTIHVDATAAKNIILTNYQSKTVAIEKMDAQPFVYVTNPGQSELAWRAYLQVTAPLKDRREILISAKSGDKLLDNSLMVY